MRGLSGQDRLTLTSLSRSLHLSNSFQKNSSLVPETGKGLHTKRRKRTVHIETMCTLVIPDRV